jgi:hypothetical protein
MDCHRKFSPEGDPSRPEEADKNGKSVNFPSNVPVLTLSPDEAAFPSEYLSSEYFEPLKPNNKRGMVNPASPVSEDDGRAGSPIKRKVIQPTLNK